MDNKEVSNNSGSTGSEKIKQISDAFLYYYKHFFLQNIIDIKLDTTGDLRRTMDLIPKLDGNIKTFIDKFSTRIGKASTELEKLVKVLLREKYGKDAARNIKSLHRFKNEIRNLYNQIVNSFKKVNSNEDCEKIFGDEKSLKILKENIVNFLINSEESAFYKKLLKIFKRRDEIEPIPGTAGLLALYVKGVLGNFFGNNKNDNNEGNKTGGDNYTKK